MPKTVGRQATKLHKACRSRTWYQNTLVVNPVTVIIFEFGKEGTSLTKVLYRVNTAQVTMHHIDSESLKLEGALFRSLNTCTLYAEFPWCLMLITEPEYCSMTGGN